MSNPIPIQQPNINPPTPSGGDSGGGLQLLVQALQHRQQLDIAKKKLALDQMHFELQKQLVGSEVAGNEADTAKKRLDLKERELQSVADDEAMQLVHGNLMRLSDPKVWGEILSKVKDKRVAGSIVQLRDHYLTSEKLAQETAEQPAIAQDIGAAGNLANPQNAQKLVAQIAMRSPVKAEQFARAWQALGDNFTPVVGPTGQVLGFNHRNSSVVDTKFNVGAKGEGTVKPEELGLAASNIIDALEDVRKFVKEDKDADIMPMVSAGIAGAKTAGQGSFGGAVAGFLGPLGTSLMSPGQLKVRRRREVFKHTYTSFLPKSRGQIAIIESVADMAFPKAGENDPEVRADAARLRDEIQTKVRKIYAKLKAGGNVSSDLASLPGFNAAVAAAAADANGTPSGDGSVTPGTATPDYGSYLQGVPK